MGAMPPGHGGMGGASDLPPGHGGMGAQAPAETDGGTPPLKKTGLGSAAELAKALAQLPDPAAKSAFEKGFRKTFTTEMPARDYDGAKPELEKVLAAKADHPATLRALGYVALNREGFPAAEGFYRKSFTADPKYGEAAYALAFLLVASDMEEASKFFKIAMGLGVGDERNLGPRYFPDIPVPAAAPKAAAPAPAAPAAPAAAPKAAPAPSK
jgi:predicted enzyme related to lactoylglutathione lyase